MGASSSSSGAGNSTPDPIRVGIEPGSPGTNNAPTLTISSPITHVISDKDCEVFGLHQRKLKGILKRMHNHSASPVEVTLRSPTSWQYIVDLYWKYGKEPVTRTLRPVRVEVVEVASEPIVAATRNFKNTTQGVAVFNAEMSHEEQNSVTTSWNISREFSIGVDVEHKIKLPGCNALNFTSSWGEGREKNQSITLRTSMGVSKELNPGESVTANLHITRTVMKVKVTYEATLQGYALAVYSCFNSIDVKPEEINDVLRAEGLPIRVECSEIVTIKYHTGGQVELSDG